MSPTTRTTRPIIRASSYWSAYSGERAGDDDIVTEGRDQGTVVFPHAQCKIYLTASPEERARRRALELAERGQPTAVADVLCKQNGATRSDASRAVGPMVPADDAIEVSTDGLTPEQVLDRLEAWCVNDPSRRTSPNACAVRFPIGCGRHL